MNGTRKNRYFRTASLIAATAILAAATAAAGNTCVTADVPNPFVLPDGSVHPAGTLRICLTSNASPVRGMHETWVAGNKLGAFMSRHGQSEGASNAAQPYIQFARLASGQWFLQGYAVPHGERYETYELHSFGPAPKGAQAERIAQGRQAEEPIVLIAAAR